MVLNTLTVGAAVTPTVVKTYASHASQPYSTVRTPLIDQQYTDRKTRAQRPTAHISYDEGLNLIRQFLNYASHHTVEEIQAFTSQWVPNPRWVRTEETTIPEEMRVRAAGAIIDQLGDKGIDRVGGKAWWQWRRDDKPLQAEWIEMRADHAQRKASGEPCKRVMLYVHGGAYFFGSVDEHRYQMQRHARKLKARVYAPRYRLAPQYPFPCGLQDCLAAYLHLLTMQDPSTIILSGDSAGGGMVVSMLVILRDQGIPLPAGAILISPWVDLTHSFPSVAGENKLDYIPAHGFMQRPSAAWPPPNADDMNEIGRHAIEKLAEDELPRKSTQRERSAAREAAVKGFSIDGNPGHLHPEQNSNNPAGHPGVEKRPGNTIPGAGHDLSIMIDGKMVEIKDQIQMYANNQLISHPLVSPVLQPTLGGLPPLLILTGGGEMLRDEQIYLAHKAANPAKYPPGEFYLNEHPEARDLIHKYKPTDVQLQVWDDLCHVAPTLSFTRPAKFMYRSVAQFGAWVLAKAQKTEIEIMDDDDVSVISSGEDTDSDGETRKQKEQTIKEGAVHGGAVSTKQIGKAGDPIPAFKGHMVRQRVNRHGVIYPLDPPSSLPALQMAANEVGVIKPGPVRKWMAAKIEWDTKYAKEKRRVQKQRIKEIARGFQSFGNDDVPPPSALAGRRGATMPKESKTKRSWGMSLWSLWGSSHDEKTIKHEEQADKEPETAVATPKQGAQDEASSRPNPNPRSRSRHRGVSDTGQTDNQGAEESVADHLPQNNGLLSPTFVPMSCSPEADSSKEPEGGSQLVLQGTNVTLDSMDAKRPKADGIAFPFKLGRSLGDSLGDNASTMTLQSQTVVTPIADAGEEKMLSSSLAQHLHPADDEPNNAEGGSRIPSTHVAATAAEVEATTADGEDRTPTTERPGVERFETAREEL